MFKSIKYHKYDSENSSYIYVLVDTDFQTEVALAAQAADAAVAATGAARAAVVEAAAAFVEYHKRNLNVSKNISILLLKNEYFEFKQFDFLKKNMQIYFDHQSTKDLNINYNLYHDDIVSEYKKLLSIK